MMQNDHKRTLNKEMRKRDAKMAAKRQNDKTQNTRPSQREAKRQQKDAKRTQINTKQLQRDTKRPVRDTKSLQSNPPKLRPFHVWPCCLIDRGGTILKRFSSSKSTVTLIQFESSQIQF